MNMTSAAYASKQVRGDVRDVGRTPSALPAHPDYAIPLPIRKYTTTNPNTLSPTYHLLYDLTQPPSPPSIPADSPRYTVNPTPPGVQPSFCGPPHHRDMKRSTESARVTVRDGPGARVPRCHLNCSDKVQINEPMSDGLIESFTKGNKEVISFNEKSHSNGADGTNNFNGSRRKDVGMCHVTGDNKHQQTEVNNGKREVDTRTHSRTVWAESTTTDISASFKPRKTSGSVLSTQSGADERGKKTSAGFNERGAGFPQTPHSTRVADRLVGCDVLHYNQVTCDSALCSASCNGAQLSDVTQVSVRNVLFSASEEVVVCDNSQEFYGIQSIADTRFENSVQSKHSNLQKRAIFKREGDSVRLFLVSEDKEFNDDSGVASDNETSQVLENEQSKNNVENRKHSLSNHLSKLPSFLRVSLRGKSKKNSPKNSLFSKAKTSSAPNLIQINNFSADRSKKNQLNRWHNLQLNSSVAGHTADDSQRVRTKKGESNPPSPADGRVINSSTVSRDLSFHPPAGLEERSGKEALDSGDVTRPSEIKGILVNKENVSRERIGHVHKANTVQFVDHRVLTFSQPSEQNRPSPVSSKTTVSNNEVIDRNKYIIKPREIGDGVSVGSNSYEGSTQSLSLQSLDSREQINDQSVKRAFISQHSNSSIVSGQNNWPREHPDSNTHSGQFLNNVNFNEIPFHTTRTNKSSDYNISLHTCAQDQLNPLVNSTQFLNSQQLGPRIVSDTQLAHPGTQPCILCSNVDIYSPRNQQTVSAADTGSDNYTKLWDAPREGGNKITPRQKFERRHNRATDKPDLRISSSGHEVGVNGPKRTSAWSGRLSDHKESPRARFERDRAARAHAIASGGHISYLAHPSDSDHRIGSNYLQESDDLENLSETSAPPPIPPRVRYVSDINEKSTNVDINSNIVTKSVADSNSREINRDTKGTNSYSTHEPNSQLSDIGVSFVSAELVHQGNSATLQQATDISVYPDPCSVNFVDNSIQQIKLTSAQHGTEHHTSAKQHTFNVSDIVSQNEYIRQVLNETTAQQLRLLFGPELHEDLASLTSQSSSHCENVTSSEAHAPPENVRNGSVALTTPDSQHSLRFVDSVKPISSAHQDARAAPLIGSDSQTNVNAQIDLKNRRSESETKTQIQGNESLDSSPRVNNTPNKPSHSSNNNLTYSTSNIKSLILTQAEAEMLAAKGIRIYDSVDDYVAMVRSPLHKSLSAPQFVWEGSTYIIVPTVLEETRAPAGPPKVPKSNHNDLIDRMAHRSISDSGTECPTESDGKATMVSDDQATYITMTSPLEKRLNVNHRAISVEVLCTGGTKPFPGGGASGAETAEPGYVEWRTCSGWAGKADLRPTAENRNSRGYVDWDTIWTPASALRNIGRDDEHVYDVIGEDSCPQTPHTNEAAREDGVDAVDAPPALPERTYINRLRRSAPCSNGNAASQDGPSHSHSVYHCHPGGRRHHHHKHHHHHSHQQHRNHHPQPLTKPLNKPPPPPPGARQYRRESTTPSPPVSQQEALEFPDRLHSYDYAEVNKLKGYTFSGLMQPHQGPPPKPHRPETSAAVSSENYCRLAPATSADSMASWQSGDVLDFIDGLHDSMSAKRRENIYILLSNKKTRAKFSESLEIESRLLSRGLILNSSLLYGGTESRVGDTGAGGGFTKAGLIKRKGATAPVSSTYV